MTKIKSSKITGNERNSKVFVDADGVPDRAYDSDLEVRDAFDAELRQLAEDIVTNHPSLTQALLALNGDGNMIGVRVRAISAIHDCLAMTTRPPLDSQAGVQEGLPSDDGAIDALMVAALSPYFLEAPSDETIAKERSLFTASERSRLDDTLRTAKQRLGLPFELVEQHTESEG